MDNNLFFYFSAVGHLGCFQLGAITNKAAVNTTVCPLQMNVFISSSKYLGLELHMDYVYVYFSKELSNRFPKWFLHVLHYQDLQVLVALHSCQYLVLFVILVDMKCKLLYFSFAFFLMTNDANLAYCYVFTGNLCITFCEVTI